MPGRWQTEQVIVAVLYTTLSRPACLVDISRPIFFIVEATKPLLDREEINSFFFVCFIFLSLFSPVTNVRVPGAVQEEKIG